MSKQSLTFLRKISNKDSSSLYKIKVENIKWVTFDEEDNKNYDPADLQLPISATFYNIECKSNDKNDIIGELRVFMTDNYGFLPEDMEVKSIEKQTSKEPEDVKDELCYSGKDRYKILREYTDGDISESQAISELMERGLSNKEAHEYLGTDDPNEEPLFTYEVQCEGIVWDLDYSDDYDEDDEENIYADNLDLPEDAVIYINASSESEAEDKIADKLSDEYGYCVNYVQNYNIQKVSSISDIKPKEVEDKSDKISYNAFLEWLHKMPREWKKFLRYFEEDEDVDIKHIGVDPRDARDYISDQDELYDIFLSEFGDKEIIYDED